MFGAIAGGIASALAGGAMSKLFGGGQKRSEERRVGKEGGDRWGGDDCKCRTRGGGWWFFFFKQKTAYEIGLGIPAEPLFRSATKCRGLVSLNQVIKEIICLQPLK